MPTAHHHHGTTNPHQPPPPRKPSTTTNCKYIETHNQIHHHLTHIATTWPTASKRTTCFTPLNPPHDPRHPNPPSDPHTTHTATHTTITNPKTPLKNPIEREREERVSAKLLSSHLGTALICHICHHIKPLIQGEKKKRKRETRKRERLNERKKKGDESDRWRREMS